MNLTTRNRTSRRRCCAPLRRYALRNASRIALVGIFAIAAMLAFCSVAPALDSYPDAPGTADLILESGLPNPSRGPGPVSGAVYSNQVVGATRFYDAGYTGTRALMANIEAGYIWNGHETLSHVGLIPTSGNALGEFDRHATVVGMIMGGRMGGAIPGLYQQGIAPDAQLYSGAIATNWIGTRFTTQLRLRLQSVHHVVYRSLRGRLPQRHLDPRRRTNRRRHQLELGGNVSFFGTAGADQIIEHARCAGERQSAHAVRRGCRKQRAPVPIRFRRRPAATTTFPLASVAYNGGAYNIAELIQQRRAERLSGPDSLGSERAAGG